MEPLIPCARAYDPCPSQPTAPCSRARHARGAAYSSRPVGPAAAQGSSWDGRPAFLRLLAWAGWELSNLVTLLWSRIIILFIDAGGRSRGPPPTNLFHLNVNDAITLEFADADYPIFPAKVCMYYLKCIPFEFCYCPTNQDTHQSDAISNPLVFPSTRPKMALKVHEISWIQTKAFEWYWLYLEIIFFFVVIIMVVSFNLTDFFSWNSLTHFQMTRMRKWWVAIVLK